MPSLKRVSNNKIRNIHQYHYFAWSTRSAAATDNETQEDVTTTSRGGRVGTIRAAATSAEVEKRQKKDDVTADLELKMKNELSCAADSSPSSSSSSFFLLEEFRRNLQKLWLRDLLVFVPTGRWRVVAQIEEELWAVLDRGGIIAGMSAGAAVMGSNMPIEYSLYEVLNDGIENCKLLGVDLNENCMAIIRGKYLQVRGDNPDESIRKQLPSAPSGNELDNPEQFLRPVDYSLPYKFKKDYKAGNPIDGNEIGSI
ncbi:hypothetical protein FRACYDRAFT_248896 [Fragilariopsis cylindrus CCMP1102]|uniref:Uncharacterized protein n=1 Tax=Fragilariopsis cylindrus CCMP1102 TaxID=635003 RepID=A0A1E7ET98_9STRA|nr:hypothetical protein FRACYDRAFT_248896 [Fragilariopsis cylindrus CCMP1102]|eukprot:OEU09066.1 hypothetical protein FRACYDRAFT_248896 [Fragilariopsis cylindrus CCMP1102]